MAGAQNAPIVPKGFRVSEFAGGFSLPTAMAAGPDQRLYVAQENGVIEVVAKHGIQTIASGFAVILCLAWHDRKLYVSSTGEIAVMTPSHNFASWSTRVLVRNLPHGEHQNDGLAFRGQWMYVGVGSTCNACHESDPRSATIMRFHDDGSHAQIYARGVRNPFGLAVRPANGQLYATDNGRDDFDNSVPDELNLIRAGGRYGWPGCWGDHQGSGCGGTIEPVALFAPHASADGIAFYTRSRLGNGYRGDAFVAEYGDDVNNLGTGHVLEVIHFGPRKVTVGTFATGFDHPLAVAVSPNGSLLVADFGTGVIWRIYK